MIRGLFRRAFGAVVSLVVVFLLIAVMIGSCDDEAKEAVDGLSGANRYTPTQMPVTTPPSPPKVTEVPESVRLDGNRLTGLQECTSSGYGTRSLKMYVETDGVWSRQSRCFIFTDSEFFGLYDDWADLMMKALPTADKPDGLWYRIPLLYPNDDIEFVWASEQQVFADVVTLDAVVRP